MDHDQSQGVHVAAPARPVVIGTRESQLAMVQATHVQSVLQSHYPHIQFDIKGMSTTGDKVLDVALSKIGSKSLFTKELEVALDDGSVDLVVHSLKDLPTTLPHGMALGAILKREDPRDAVIMSPANAGLTIAQLPSGAVIGTSSVRRSAQLRRRFPHLLFQDVRGNLNTRLRKLDDPDSPYAALILAFAGVHRLGWTDRISEILQPDVILHAVGQGALGIECRESDARVLDLIKPLSDPETMIRCMAERAFMRTLEGGCSVPLGVTTKITTGEESDARDGSTVSVLHLTGSVTKLDGSHEIREAASLPLDDTDGFAGQLATADKLGKSLASILLDLGAREILDEIRHPIVVPPSVTSRS